MLMYEQIVYGFLPEINVFVFDTEKKHANVGPTASFETVLCLPSANVNEAVVIFTPTFLFYIIHQNVVITATTFMKRYK